MHTVNVPSVADGSSPVTLSRWLKKPGEAVNAGEVFVELELEDRLIQLEAKQAGKLVEALATAGKVLPAGSPLATFDIATAAPAAPAAPAAKPTPAAAPAAAPAAKPTGGPVIPVLMPQAGNSMEEGTIIIWKVKVGDRVTVGQILYETETDKASVEVESTDAGRIARIVADKGAVVPVKQPVAYLAESDADVEAFLASQSGAAAATTAPASAATAVAESAAAISSTPTTPAARTDSGRVKASPAARKLAEERHLDLAGIGAGSGPGGRILSTDLTRAPAATTPATPAASSNGKGLRKPLTKMRKAIATNLQVSKQTVPHFYVRLTINADPMFTFYRAQKPTTGCTVNDVVLLAVGRAVGEITGFRSRIDGNDIVESPTANIGVAVGLDEGLVVPVILNVDRLSLAQLAAESKRIIDGARTGKLENMGKGVFTISNMGMMGVEEFSAIINPPESGILAIGSVRETVLVKDGALKPGKVMTMTLSVDHRVVDGSLAAKFMARLKELLEMPEKLA